MIPASKIDVRLTLDERNALELLVHIGSHPAHATRRARILLKADANGPDAWPDEPIAQTLDINRMTVARVRAQFAAEGLDATLHKKKAKDRQYRKRDGQQEAPRIALACSPAPTRRTRGTMTLLADRLVEMQVVEMQVVDSIDPATVWKTLKKTTSNRGSSSSGSSQRR